MSKRHKNVVRLGAAPRSRRRQAWFDSFDFWFTRVGVAVGALTCLAILIAMAVKAVS